jgi:hypothetical protein
MSSRAFLLLLFALAGSVLLGAGAQAVAASGESLNFNPPRVVMTSVAGRQQAVRGSSCITVPTGTGFVTACGDTPDVEPRWLSVVRPKEHITLRVRAKKVDGAFYVHPRGCERRITATFKIKHPQRRWVVHLRPGRYELSFFLNFLTADGRFGDTSGTLGLLVSRTRDLELIPAGDSLSCRV